MFPHHVSGDAVAAVHDGSAGVHASLRCSDKFPIWRAASPDIVDECVGVEEGGEVFPLAGISTRAVVRSKFHQQWG